MSDCKHEAALREASGLLVLDDPHNPIAYDWARVLDAAADHIAAQRAAIDRLTRERDEARATRSRLWRCVEGAWMSCHTCAQEYQYDDMTPTADGWICDDCKALAAEGE